MTLKSPLNPMGSAHGHTGHVRFLTSIELPEGFDVKFPPATSAESTGRPLPFLTETPDQRPWSWNFSHCNSLFVCAGLVTVLRVSSRGHQTH